MFSVWKPKAKYICLAQTLTGNPESLNPLMWMRNKCPGAFERRPGMNRLKSVFSEDHSRREENLLLAWSWVWGKFKKVLRFLPPPRSVEWL